MTPEEWTAQYCALRNEGRALPAPEQPGSGEIYAAAVHNGQANAVVPIVRATLRSGGVADPGCYA